MAGCRGWADTVHTKGAPHGVVRRSNPDHRPLRPDRAWRRHAGCPAKARASGLSDAAPLVRRQGCRRPGGDGARQTGARYRRRAGPAGHAAGPPARLRRAALFPAAGDRRRGSGGCRRSRNPGKGAPGFPDRRLRPQHLRQRPGRGHAGRPGNRRPEVPAERRRPGRRGTDRTVADGAVQHLDPHRRQGDAEGLPQAGAGHPPGTGGRTLPDRSGEVPQLPCPAGIDRACRRRRRRRHGAMRRPGAGSRCGRRLGIRAGADPDAGRSRIAEAGRETGPADRRDAPRDGGAV